MKAHTNADAAPPIFWRRLALALAGAAALGMVSPADARWRARGVSFAAVASAADLDPLAGDNLRPAERAFLRQAIESNRREMRLAQVGLSQATSAEVRTFAQQLTTDCRQIVDALEGLARKKGVVLMAAAEPPGENHTRLTELTGATFDREFVRMVFDATDEITKVFDQALADAKDPEIRDVAGNYLPALREHANRVRELRKAME